MPPDQRLWLATVAEDNAGPAVFWVRLEPVAGLPSSGSFGLAFPQSLALSDVDGDGRDDLLVFGAQFTGESPPEHGASEAWELPPGAPAPIRHPRLSALALAIGAADDDALPLLRQQLDQFIAAGPQTDPAAFVIGLDRATPADLRDVIPGNGLTLCSGATSGSRPRARCRRLSRAQLTDETIRATVMPALGRFPITMREPPRAGFRFWTDNVSCGVCSQGPQDATWCTSSGPEGRVRWWLAPSADRWTLVRIESPPAEDDACR